MTLVIFDCDGVLIDSEILSCGVVAEALTGAGYPVTRDEVIARFAGVPSPAMFAAVEADMGRPLPADFAERVEALEAARYREGVPAIPGVADVLAALAVPKCVASSSAPAKLALGLIQAGLYEMVYPHVFSTVLVARGKPAPDIFLYAARAMGAAAADCVVVEDSVAGVTAGVAAGMRVVGFTGGAHCGPGHAGRLMAAGAGTVIGEIAALPGLIAPE